MARNYITDFVAGTDRVCIDTSIASDYADLDAAIGRYNESNWGIIEFADGQLVLLRCIDATKLSAGWFNYALV